MLNYKKIITWALFYRQKGVGVIKKNYKKKNIEDFLFLKDYSLESNNLFQHLYNQNRESYIFFRHFGL